uniref:Uncharacterized protein n=1 Tax=Utricularia reniformis TaxID=192314 RepID=A0A1Y0B4L1_9LAMI|nr:hypothetical protein AEK19_MT2251 [Utricularia reniformis]ART32396.1 hypothetical protein AEK19_MT2251 [Utricularia reniformis]
MMRQRKIEIRERLFGKLVLESRQRQFSLRHEEGEDNDPPLLLVTLFFFRRESTGSM